MAKISAGSYDLNKWLFGGYESDIVSVIYGSAGSGKTNFCLCVVASQAKKGNIKTLVAAFYKDFEFVLTQSESIDPVQLTLLRIQQAAMATYLQCLKERIERIQVNRKKVEQLNQLMLKPKK
jgi:KaiC/GvpD/RAD55 family RecA-like ATPase